MAYGAARDRLCVLLRTCDDALRNGGVQATGQETADPAVLEALERKLEELKEEARRKNRLIKGLIDLLRNMSNDFVMWDCCGKMSSTVK